MTIINSINRGSLTPAASENQAKAGTPGFADRLKTAIESVNEKQHTGDQSAEQVVQGTLGIHEGMVNMAEADISFRLLAQVRNKAMAAYQEIMRMQF